MANSRLKPNCLGFTELLAQGIALISPTMTAALIVPVMYSNTGDWSWLSYALGTIMLLFVAYNLNDAVLVTRILDTLGLIDLSIERSLLTGMPLDQVSASIASFDSLYLPELRRREPGGSGRDRPAVRGARRRLRQPLPDRHRSRSRGHP